jgi:hypothetical protein
MCNTRRWSLKFYDAFQPLRDIIANHPELEQPLVETLGKAMTNAFADSFYGGKKPATRKYAIQEQEDFL